MFGVARFAGLAADPDRGGDAPAGLGRVVGMDWERALGAGPQLKRIDRYFLYWQEADPQDLRAHPRGRADAESDRGPEEFLRSFLADGGGRRAARQYRAAGGVQIGLPDSRFLGPGPARIRPLRAGDAEI